MSAPDAARPTTGWSTIDVAAPQPRQSAVEGPARTGAPFRVALRRSAHPVTGAFDDGAATLQACGRTMMVGASLVLVPVAALGVLAARAIFDHYDRLDGSVVSLPEFIAGIHAATGIETLLAYLAIVCGSLSAALVGGLAAQLHVRRLFGQPTGVRACLGPWARSLPSLTVAWLLGHAWIFLGALLLVQLPTGDGGAVALAVIFGGPIAAVLTLVTLMASAAVAVEHLGPLAALRRSARLFRCRRGWTFGHLVLTIAIGGAMRWLLTAVPRLLELTQFVSFGRFGGPIESVSGQLAQLVVVPLVGAATAGLYVQIRLHAEGMDLTVDAGRAFG